MIKPETGAPFMIRESPVEANDRHTTLPGLRWPGGRHVAVVLNVAYEVWSQGQVSGVGPMGNPLPAGIFDTNADSYGRYGAVDGIRRLMRKLEQAHATADIFTSGALAERESQLVKAIADAGHGIIGHGYTQDIIHAKLSSADDEKYVRLATKLLTEVTGRQPTGWVSPRATPGPDTARHLAQLGYKWQCDSLDADLPYVQEFEQGSLVAIPLTVEFNDLSHSMRFGRTPRQFIDIFEDTLEATLADTNDTVILDVLVHAHCYGRPAGAWAFGEIAQRCVARDDIWLTTREQVADHFHREIVAS
jgi:peptidoglycan/xylan/chitin deacetylase (PgdA/CDA1 family)